MPLFPYQDCKPSDRFCLSHKDCHGCEDLQCMGSHDGLKHAGQMLADVESKWSEDEMADEVERLYRSMLSGGYGEDC